MKSIARKLSLRKDKDNTSTEKGSTEASSAQNSSTAQNQPNQQSASATTSNTMAPNLPKSYKAAVITGQQKPLEIQELPMPEVKEGEIVVKVKACGVCHSDHHVVNGDMGPP